VLPYVFTVVVDYNSVRMSSHLLTGNQGSP
jgi:hypothetical protein